MLKSSLPYPKFARIRIGLAPLDQGPVAMKMAKINIYFHTDFDP